MCKNNILRVFKFMALPGIAWKSPTVLGLDSADTILPNDSYHADHLRMFGVTLVKVHLNIRGFVRPAPTLNYCGPALPSFEIFA
jgi:hypothetical protein